LLLQLQEFNVHVVPGLPLTDLEQPVHDVVVMVESMGGINNNENSISYIYKSIEKYKLEEG
jgi:hypothetical protein